MSLDTFAEIIGFEEFDSNRSFIIVCALSTTNRILLNMNANTGRNVKEKLVFVCVCLLPPCILSERGCGSRELN